MKQRPSYKKIGTEVVPEDWDVSEIDGKVELLTGFPFPSKGYVKSGIRLLRGSNIKRGETDWENDNTQYWPAITPDIAHYALAEGDLVIAMDGSLVGRSFARIADKDLPALLLQRVARIRSNCIDIGYLTEFISSERFIKYSDSVKTVTAIPHISPKDIRNFKIPLPKSTDEQRSIAKTLSDVDSLIRGLDQLIAKKRNIKQAAMQQLLTGKKRLHGFSTTWNMKRFGDIASPRKERISPGQSNALEFCIELEHIEQETGRLLGSTRTREQLSQKTLFRPGDVLFGKLRAYLRKYWLADREGVCTTEIWPLVPNSKLITSMFLFQHVKMDRFIKIASNAYGTHMPRSDWNVMRNYEVPIPPHDEQNAIVTVLADMDAEIEALEKRRDKTRLLKQGMMQELLTGRTRLQ